MEAEPMRYTLSRAPLLLALAAAVSACITVNIYFPAPEVRAAAEEIVEETWGSNAATEPNSSLPAPPIASQPSLFRNLGVRAAYAQNADINVSTAAIRTLKASIKKRASQLKPHLTGGALGLDKSGMLKVRDLAGLPIKEQAELRRLVDAENRDRRSLYEEIAAANDFGKDRVDDIQKIFADEWRDEAEPGWWIENDSGTWSRR
jgi:uncharacterized protein YdbL (DUF1318 family)